MCNKQNKKLQWKSLDHLQPSRDTLSPWGRHTESDNISINNKGLSQNAFNFYLHKVQYHFYLRLVSPIQRQCLSRNWSFTPHEHNIFISQGKSRVLKLNLSQKRKKKNQLRNKTENQQKWSICYFSPYHPNIIQQMGNERIKTYHVSVVILI